MGKKNHILHSCLICNKKYSSYQSLWAHNKKFHKSDESPLIEIINSKIIQCELCSKKFNTRQAKCMHKKKCKKIEENNKIQILEEKIKKIEEKNKELENKINNKNINNINNGNINNGTINNIQIVALGREDLSKLTEKEQKNILKCGSASLKKIITDINFNPKFPENQNIKLTNLAKKNM